MNMAEKFEAIGDILSSDDLCAEAMVSAISEIVFAGDNDESEVSA